MKILEDKAGMSAYEAAVYDIMDPLVPVRGHGLIELARLVDEKVDQKGALMWWSSADVMIKRYEKKNSVSDPYSFVTDPNPGENAFFQRQEQKLWGTFLFSTKKVGRYGTVPVFY